MNSQLYSAASGLLIEQRRLELVSNNLANLSTTGYRAQRVYSTGSRPFASIAAEAVRATIGGAAVAGAYEVPGPGPMRPTGHPLDIALEDGTLLTLDTPAGRRYTRAGDLQLSPDGDLIDARGHRLLDENLKPIQGLGPDASISEDGRVLSGAAEVGRLRLVRDPAGVLRREGSNLLTAEGADSALEVAEDATVRPGWLESSGTSALGELVELIEAQRAFQTYQKLVSMTMNEVNRRAANDLAG